MEERIMDEDELRGIKRRREGDEGDETETDEPLYEISDESYPEDEAYDEDLVGLTPTQLQEELERRERQRQEAHEKSMALRAQGEEASKNEDYESAVRLFEKALDVEYDEETETLLWWARTEGLKSSDALFDVDIAEKFSAAGAMSKKLVRDAFGEELANARAALSEEAEPLRVLVRAGQEKRRAPFIANRNYYLIRFLVSAVLMVLFAVGIGVSASYLLRTQSNLPTVLIIVFGVLTAFSAAFFIYFSRKLLVAVRLCNANETLSSTEEGERLEELEDALTCIDLVLNDEVEEYDE